MKSRQPKNWPPGNLFSTAEFRLPHTSAQQPAERSRKILYIGTPEPNLSEYMVQHNFLRIGMNSVSKAQTWLGRMATAHSWAQRMRQSFTDLPDAILCDQKLPDGDAFLLFNFIKANEHLRYIPFILLVPDPKPEILQAALEAGMDDCYTWQTAPDKIGRRLLFLCEYKRETMRIQDEADPPPVFNVPLWKRTFDLVVSFGLLWLLSPFMLLVALLIKLESKGPVFYISKRAGTGYRIFDFYKFRSMRVGAEDELDEVLHLNQYGQTGFHDLQTFQRCAECMLENRPCEVPMEKDGEQICAIRHEREKQIDRKTEFVKIKNDPRVTRVGRFMRRTSLDELPQLFNVLIGDMSIVGNRPLPIYEAEKLTVDYWAKRFLAPAGITGLWQVKWRKAEEMSPEERKDLDAEYAEKASFWFDIKILLRTIPAIFQKEAA